jgi:predicted phosphoribosyltransferase
VQPKFRKGDRLVCVESWSNWLTVGKIYEVMHETQSDDVYVLDNDRDTILCHASRFKLAPAN